MVSGVTSASRNETGVFYVGKRREWPDPRHLGCLGRCWSLSALLIVSIPATPLQFVDSFRQHRVNLRLRRR